MSDLGKNKSAKADPHFFDHLCSWLKLIKITHVEGNQLLLITYKGNRFLHMSVINKIC